MAQERQMGKTIESIRADHLYRYQFAKNWLVKSKLTGTVLDAGCGTGYGSALLSSVVTSIDCVDQSAEAFEHHQQHFARDNVVFHCDSLLSAAGLKDRYDAVVCFEFLEHIHEAPEAVAMFADKSDVLISSVPNDLVWPWARKPQNEFHVRHYTPAQYRDLLEAAGYRIIEMRSQQGGQADVLPGDKGRFLVSVAVQDSDYS